MGQKLQGFIIRKYRQERKWSQSSLCRGICAVSYLSKIEQGKAEGSPEVLTLLFRRLGIPWREDPAFCREAGAWLEECYDRLFSGENMGRVLEVLREREEAYCSSPFLLDWLLLSWAMTGESKVELKDFVPAMDARQLSLYLCLEGRFQELLRISGRSYFYLEAGKHAYWKGDYSYAVSCLQQGVDRAAQEGSLPGMMFCRLFLGNCYSSLNQTEQTREQYAAAGRMARTLGADRPMRIIAYNQAAMELQMGLTEDALRHLLEHPWHEAMYYQKLAICYERLGRREDARKALRQAETAPLKELSCNADLARDVFQQLCGLIQFRLDHSGYLQIPEYGKALVACMQCLEQQFSASFVRFYAAWLEEWYSANRQYRKAYELLRKFS